MSSDQYSWLNPSRALAGYACIFSLFIIWASLPTAINPARHGGAVQILAGAEIAGAFLFLFRKPRLIGLFILLVVFAVAAAIELHLREWPVRLVFYAASAMFVQYLSIHLDEDADRIGTTDAAGGHPE